MNKKIFSVLAVFVLACGLSVAVSAKGKKGKWVGYLTDKKCSARGADHSRGCVIKCKDAGVGLFVDGTFYAFDAAGTTQALKLMEASTAEKVLKVQVNGELEDTNITVKKIKEVK
ncbi:MAG: hypothetical protein ACKV2V_21050 [Blastocatellia bacterium]